MEKFRHAFGKVSRVLVAVVALATLLSAAAYAAQDSTVVTENAPVRIEPSPDAKIIDYLALGTEVRVSSWPLAGGWYRVRARTGDYGWVHESDLSVRKMPRPQVQVTSPEGGEQVTPEPAAVLRPERDRVWYVRGAFGIDFFSPSDLNEVFGFSELSNGYVASGELGRMITRNVSLGMRFDVLSKDVVAKEARTGIVYNLALRSYPIMAGFDFFFSKWNAFKFSGGVFGGIAYSTSFSSEALTLSNPNVLVLQAHPLTALVRVNVTRPLGRVLSVGTELGYRMLKTDSIATQDAATIAGGSQIFGRTGVYTPREINLSGPYFTLMLGIYF